MRFRMLIGVGGALVVVATAQLGSSAGAVRAHGPNLWAGNWTTSTGNLGFRLMSKEDIANAEHEARVAQLFDKLPCHGPQYYRGGYFSTSDAGKIIGCGTPTRLAGRYVSINKANIAGSFSLRIVSRKPLRFGGDDSTYTPDPRAGQPATKHPWTGNWVRDFRGDGRCGSTAFLTVVTPKIGLLQTETLKATPASATSFTFELKRAREQTWHRLARGRGNSFKFVARIAGHFDVRVTVTENGK